MRYKAHVLKTIIMWRGNGKFANTTAEVTRF